MSHPAKGFLLDIRKFSPFSPWHQSYGLKRQKEPHTATLESILHTFCCSWYNFLKVKTPSVRVISKVQIQPRVWVHRRTSTHTNTRGLLTISYLVCKSGRQMGRYHSTIISKGFPGMNLQAGLFLFVCLFLKHHLPNRPVGEFRLSICIAVTVESCT